MRPLIPNPPTDHPVLQFKESMFIFDCPLKAQIMELRKSLSETRAELEPLIASEKRAEDKGGLGWALTTLFCPPKSMRRRDELIIRKNNLEFELAHLFLQYVFNTPKPNAETAQRLDLAVEKAVIHQMRGLHDLAAFSPREFEGLISRFFTRLGWAVDQTPYVNDGGKDAIMRKDGKTAYLECKHYLSGGQVGRPHLQKLKGAMVDANVDMGFLVTSSEVSEPARAYASKNGILLITGRKLNEELWAMEMLTPKITIKNYVLHCGNCLRKHDFVSSNKPTDIPCECGNTVSNSSLHWLGESKSSLPKRYE